MITRQYFQGYKVTNDKGQAMYTTSKKLLSLIEISHNMVISISFGCYFVDWSDIY